MKKEKILSLIPARAGSKGLPSKNKLSFAGMPLVAHAMDFSRQLSEHLDVTTLVLTNDQEIQQIANEYLGDMGYRREDMLSQDETSMNDTVAHAVEWCGVHNIDFDWILLLQPTSPLRTIDGVLDMIRQATVHEQKDECCFASVSPLKVKRYELIYKGEGGAFRSLARRDSDSRRQKFDSEAVYFEDGAAFLTRASFYQKYNKLVDGEKMEYLLTSSERITDIDDQEDFDITEFMFQSRQS
jgi:CMP-N,N'-diacetyllegionaminic acid synthase